MGCGGSKVDNQQIVILCRERKELIKAASYHRSALAVAHLTYFQSLSDVGEAIQRFVDDEGLLVGSSSSSSSPDSPVLTLPSDEGKPKKHQRISPSSTTSISHSIIEEEDDSHLHLSSGSESESESEAGSNDHIQIESTPEQERSTQTFHSGYDPTTYAPPVYPPGYPPSYPPGYIPGYQPSYPSGYSPGYPSFNPNANRGMYFMKKSAPQSRPFIFQPENHRVENAQWPSDSGFGNNGVQRRSPSPAPPPSPPTVSTWDFLNVFDTYDYSNARSRASGYYPMGMASISSSPDSKEVREREGIPELEEVTEQEVIKQVYRRPKRTGLEKVKEHRDEDEYNAVPERNINKRGSVGEETMRAVPVPDKATESSLDSETVSSFSGSDVDSEFHYVNGGEGKSSTSSNSHETLMGRKSPGEVGEEYGRKKGVSFELEETSSSSFDVESSKISSLSSLSIHATRDLRETVKEIKSEFEVASSCGKEVAVLLEVGKLPYQHKNNGFKVILSRIMYLVAPSTQSSHSHPRLSIRLTSRTRKMAKAYNGQDVNGGFNGNLSSTLEKLYAWEKKLYKEVKDEEKFRAIYEEKCRRLKKMDSHGAESIKIEATRAAIRKLLTKIDVCIRSVDSISSRIHILRDEELQPQLTHLIHGLIRMWRSMLKCHQKQFHAIMESKVRSLKANITLQKDSGSKAILDLEMELREWSSSFNNWVNTQKSYVQSLSGWLSKCLHYEPVATEDGIAPFSPSQIGAPPIFIICKDWQETMGRISGDNVTKAMQSFASSLHELREQQEEEQRVKAQFEQRDAESERSLVSRGKSESGISALDDLKVDLDSMRKKLVEERGKRKETIKVVNNASSSSLKNGLVPIFGALRKFTAEVVKAHEIVRLQHPQTSS
ncbi:hypothetical protein CARUB_v10019768mg [Capsella rubella]|uniref:DUF632 domain-containing protein n=1 Tax=Capsella rubella TaxID=81985 RepID=R0HUW1_9BRAS|nr:nitrate regulatory gene2 protein [Capsella rubella]EOA33619.1 hypothetical protein CARUB_v10019768mg [Capsella rubella]